ncbi:hypothetical protein BIW11_08307 [Tropilaelaps mercedesae]|uniref:Uncharacterized protein n=1 Tax=Tropilaelaps mercedesae TaxID=418985 RepID=A0A1V9XQ30_9ACAR|nr:hypothetical protein BIW11_08307 [Tropilaelaps mercedesae]
MSQFVVHESIASDVPIVYETEIKYEGSEFLSFDEDEIASCGASAGSAYGVAINTVQEASQCESVATSSRSLSVINDGSDGPLTDSGHYYNAGSYEPVNIEKRDLANNGAAASDGIESKRSRKLNEAKFKDFVVENFGRLSRKRLAATKEPAISQQCGLRDRSTGRVYDGEESIGEIECASVRGRGSGFGGRRGRVGNPRRGRGRPRGSGRVPGLSRNVSGPLSLERYVRMENGRGLVKSRGRGRGGGRGRSRSLSLNFEQKRGRGRPRGSGRSRGRRLVVGRIPSIGRGGGRGRGRYRSARYLFDDVEVGIDSDSGCLDESSSDMYSMAMSSECQDGTSDLAGQVGPKKRGPRSGWRKSFKGVNPATLEKIKQLLDLNRVRVRRNEEAHTNSPNPVELIKDKDADSVQSASGEAAQESAASGVRAEEPGLVSAKQTSSLYEEMMMRMKAQCGPEIRVALSRLEVSTAYDEMHLCRLDLRRREPHLSRLVVSHKGGERTVFPLRDVLYPSGDAGSWRDVARITRRPSTKPALANNGDHAEAVTSETGRSDNGLGSENDDNFVYLHKHEERRLYEGLLLEDWRVTRSIQGNPCRLRKTCETTNQRAGSEGASSRNHHSDGDEADSRIVKRRLVQSVITEQNIIQTKADQEMPKKRESYSIENEPASKELDELKQKLRKLQEENQRIFTILTAEQREQLDQEIHKVICIAEPQSQNATVKTESLQSGTNQLTSEIQTHADTAVEVHENSKHLQRWVEPARDATSLQGPKQSPQDPECGENIDIGAVLHSTSVRVLKDTIQRSSTQTVEPDQILARSLDEKRKSKVAYRPTMTSREN